MLIMAGFLADLLGAREPQFTFAVKDLEKASGYPSADVHLITDISGKVQRKKRELGLDPHDTTGAELYHGLLDLVRQHDGFVVAAIGGRDPADVDDILGRLPQVVKKLTANPKVLALKHSVAKRLLQKMPPRAVMKQLGYRSVDSMLKRELLSAVYVGLHLTETPQWRQRFVQSFKRLKPGDFELRPIEIMQLDKKRWGSLADAFIRTNRNNILCLKELGVIAILPAAMKRLPGIGITALARLLHDVNELRLHSAHAKFQQVRPDFGRFIANSLLDGPSVTAAIVNQPVSWRVIQRLYGRQARGPQPEIFEPHVQPDDLAWQGAEDVLYKLEPALLFWRDLDYVGAHHDHRPISLNLLDMAINYCNGLAYGQQTVSHLQTSLHDELLSRYISQPSLEQQILHQLDNQLDEVPTFQPVFSMKGSV